MAEGKHKIIVYRDWKATFEALSDEEAGRLIKHFFRYINDENPEAPDRLTGLMFEPIKQTLKRDLKRYEAICAKNKENVGIRWNKDDTTEYDRIRPDTIYTDSDSDSDNDSNSVAPTKEELLKKRESEFTTEVLKFSDIYPVKMLNDFLRHWTEPNKSKSKMRWELEKTFEISRRLAKWASNDKIFNKQQHQPYQAPVQMLPD